MIAQVNEKRLEKYASVPTIKEAGFDVPYYAVFRGIVGPPEMSRDTVAYYEDFFGRLVKTAAWKKYLEENFFDDGFQKSAEFGKFIDEFAEVPIDASDGPAPWREDFLHPERRALAVALQRIVR